MVAKNTKAKVSGISVKASTKAVRIFTNEMSEYANEVAKDEKNAIKYLKRLGTLTTKGNLSKKYY